MDTKTIAGSNYYIPLKQNFAAAEAVAKVRLRFFELLVQGAGGWEEYLVVCFEEANVHRQYFEVNEYSAEVDWFPEIVDFEFWTSSGL